MSSCTVTVTNIKVSLKIKIVLTLKRIYETLRKNKLIVKEYSNFLVIKKKYTYTLFASGHVNITGISRTSLVQPACDYICNLFSTIEKCPHTVDNISAITVVPHKINLRQLIKIDSPNFTTSFNTEIFPGLFMRTSTATVIVFRSGKLVIVGAKTVQCVRDTLMKVWPVLLSDTVNHDKTIFRDLPTCK